MKAYKPETFGVMLDVSRNAVMSLKALKEYLVYLNKMGYNCVYLYNEDCYEIPEEPYFGYMRGRYSIAEMKELDAYADSLGIEIIPCIQTLAHLRSFSRWKQASFEIDDTLMVDDERTYELVDRMIKTVSECFRTRRIHVGMDEAFELGRGQHLSKYGYENFQEMMRRHLARVNAIVEKYGCRAIVWSDMFVKTWSGKYLKLGDEETVRTVPQEAIDSVPKNVELVYWDYYSLTKEHYLKNLKVHAQYNNEIWFAGGVWCWRSLAPSNTFSIDTMVPALDACREMKTKHIVMTMWGDNGCECSRYATLPALLYLAEYMRGNTDEEKIKAKFKRIFGYDYDAFMLLDKLDIIYPEKKGPGRTSRKALYSDLFGGFCDLYVKRGQGEEYAALAEKLQAHAKKSRKWNYLFDCYAKMAAVFATKYELGCKTREAYKAGNKEELLRLAKEDYTLLYKQLREFLPAFRKQWYAENKTYGFDCQEIRVGGVIARVESCKARLLDYCAGKIDRIEELEEELLPLYTDKFAVVTDDYDAIATASTLWGQQ
ncbi:MAG: beta-N-acetylhexosaminidase [Clostridia bacterium]|nr:beta-N-acetylhexosaminidase [Clostridia bacterium]